MKNPNAPPLVHHLALKDRSGRVVGERDVISLAGLLDLAHREHLSSIDTTIIQFPTPENETTTIVRAVVTTARGKFIAIGDANPRNVAPQIAPHCIRMAETRAVARALRLAVNVGTVAIEELDGAYDDRPEPPPANDNAAQPAPTAPVQPVAVPTRVESSRASDQQRRYVYRLLQERGIEGERARDLIQRELGVASVKDAPKAAVSAFIEKLTHAGNGASNGGAA